MMKEIDKAIKGRFQYKDTELKWILQQLHHHHHENWKKKERHQKCLTYMFNVKDKLLNELKPSSLSWDEFNNDCELMISESRFHSVSRRSETDLAELA
ncbi:uncharacterized protein OCT59_003610 [Rhizophagus irregularis]|uniref:uncharacterized protein n=1 Tax=Rhizophagus irregularis TaxID=588596 RepID=UPI0033172D54|nr:hypothetical protein OCT59_003610 [Rhizophagus irregularis]